MIKLIKESAFSRNEFEQFTNYVYSECKKVGFIPYVSIDTRDMYDPDKHLELDYNGFNSSIYLFTDKKYYGKLGKDYGTIYLYYGYDDSVDEYNPIIAIMFNYGDKWQRISEDTDIEKICKSYSDAKSYAKELISTLGANASIFGIKESNGGSFKERKYGSTVESNSRLYKKRYIKERNQRTNGSDLVIDMWYGDEFNKYDYDADAAFYPNEGVYRGNIYDKTGKIVGDYSCSDSVTIAKELGVIFR